MHKLFSVIRFFKDAFVPAFCPLCLKETDKGGICFDCHCELEDAVCDDYRFSFDLDGYTVNCASVFYYRHDRVKSLVMFMKKNTDNRVYMYAAARLARIIRSFCLSSDTFITYIPRSKSGLLENGFDQSELLSRTVARIIPSISFKKLLKRSGSSKTQKSLAEKYREENVKGKFRALKTDASPKNIIITDDMYTTGASMRECAAVLKKAYPKAELFCVTVAKNSVETGSITERII